eukprot:jgi/Ulvmu1/7387/UM036_0047.1
MSIGDLIKALPSFTDKAMPTNISSSLAVSFCAGFVIGSALYYQYHKQCPTLEQLWEAALRGDAAVVRRLIRQLAVPPNTPHPRHGAQLLLEVAEVETLSESKDQRLRDVLEDLMRAGWAPDVQRPETGENMLHLLSAQPPHTFVHNRIQHILDGLPRPTLLSMLKAADSAGRLPEARAVCRRGYLEDYLKGKRQKAEAS